MSSNNTPGNQNDPNKESSKPSKLRTALLYSGYTAVIALQTSVVVDVVKKFTDKPEPGTPSSGIAFVPNAQGKFVELSAVFGESQNLKPGEMTKVPFQPAQKIGRFSLN